MVMNPKRQPRAFNFVRMGKGGVEEESITSSSTASDPQQQQQQSVTIRAWGSSFPVVHDDDDDDDDDKLDGTHIYTKRKTEPNSMNNPVDDYDDDVEKNAGIAVGGGGNYLRASCTISDRGAPPPPPPPPPPSSSASPSTPRSMSTGSNGTNNNNGNTNNTSSTIPMSSSSVSSSSQQYFQQQHSDVASIRSGRSFRTARSDDTGWTNASSVKNYRPHTALAVLPQDDPLMQAIGGSPPSASASGDGSARDSNNNIHSSRLSSLDAVPESVMLSPDHPNNNNNNNKHFLPIHQHHHHHVNRKKNRSMSSTTSSSASSTISPIRWRRLVIAALAISIMVVAVIAIVGYVLKEFGFDTKLLFWEGFTSD